MLTNVITSKDTSKLAYTPTGKHLSSGAYSRVEENDSTNTLTYFTNTERRIEFLQELGVLHDAPIMAERGHRFCNGRFTYAVTVTKLVPHEFFTREQLIMWETEKYFIERAWFDLYNKDEFMQYVEEHKDEFPIFYPALAWSWDTYGTIYRDWHDGNVLACPITGKVFAYDIINIDAAEENYSYIDSDDDSYWHNSPSYYSESSYYSSESENSDFLAWLDDIVPDSGMNSNEPE